MNKTEDNSKQFLVWMKDPDTHPVIIGVGTSYENAKAIAKLSNDTFDGCFEYEFTEIIPNATAIDNIAYLMKDGKLQADPSIDPKNIFIKHNCEFDDYEVDKE